MTAPGKPPGEDRDDPREEAIDEAFASYLQLVDTEGAPDLERFLEEHAEISADLRELITTASTVEKMASGGDEHGGTEPEGRADTLPFHQPADPESPGTLVQLFGEYELIEELGRGGMGVVYKARQSSMNRLVALKMIISGGYSSEESIRRFYKEAKAAGKLTHGNIVGAYAAGEHEGRHFFAMELIEGRTLREILKTQAERLPNETIARYMKSLAEAVEFAHDQGILHRDLKPSNIIIDQNDVPKIADFGLAKHLDPDDDCSFESSLGAVIGTPSYMSPEQAAPRRHPVGPGSDVYSLGAVLYELLTGQPPFKDESPVGTLLLVLNQDLIPPSEINPHCDRDLEAICLKCLEKRPEERYACCEELALDFDRFLEGERVHARRLTYLQKLWFWVRGMPLVAYATGRNPAYATTTQRRTQWAMIAVLLLGLGACLAAPKVIEHAYLRRIELGVAEVAGEYDRIGHLLAASLLPDGAEVVNTRGSLDSRDKLLRRDVDLCILQDNTVSFADIAIVAPLYREAVLVIVRRGSDIDQARDLADRAIALGDPTSGCRATSEQILDSLGITTLAPFRNHAWTDLARNESLEGAIVTVSPRDSRLTELLATGQFRMVPLEHDELPERFRPHRFSAADLPDGAAVGAEGLAAATAEAVLVVRKTAPASFVRSCLEQIYEADNDELSAAILDPVHAAAWSEGRLLHPAAREFFKKNLGQAR